MVNIFVNRDYVSRVILERISYSKSIIHFPALIRE